MLELSALTINLRREHENDGENNWPNRKEYAARLIQENGPHLFGTQEGRKPQILSLYERLTGFARADRHRYWDPNRFYPTIFYRFETFELCDSGDQWLSETPEDHASKSWGSAFPRLATWARLRHKRTGGKFIFTDTHFDHISSEARAGQARTLLKLLSDINGDHLPVIIVGDFNDTPDSLPYQILAEQYDDAWRRLHRPDEEVSTWHGFSGVGQRGRLDWVLISPEVEVKAVKILRTSYDNVFPSDHFPVLANLRLP